MHIAEAARKKAVTKGHEVVSKHAKKLLKAVVHHKMQVAVHKNLNKTLFKAFNNSTAAKKSKKALEKVKKALHKAKKQANKANKDMKAKHAEVWKKLKKSKHKTNVKVKKHIVHVTPKKIVYKKIVAPKQATHEVKAVKDLHVSEMAAKNERKSKNKKVGKKAKAAKSNNVPPHPPVWPLANDPSETSRGQNATNKTPNNTHHSKRWNEVLAKSKAIEARVLADKAAKKGVHKVFGKLAAGHKKVLKKAIKSHKKALKKAHKKAKKAYKKVGHKKALKKAIKAHKKALKKAHKKAKKAHPT